MSCDYTLNGDISGIGVRLSFYLQTLFLGCLSVRSGSIEEISGALYTLMATNAAMAVTGLILGLKSEPDISLQDALIIIYLLSMSWCTVFASLAFCHQLSEDTGTLQVVSVIQSYLILSFHLVVLGRGETFGQSPDCNYDAVVVFFHRFKALGGGRIFGLVVVSLMAVAYSTMTARDYLTKIRRKLQHRAAQPENVIPPIKRHPIPPVFSPHTSRQPQSPVLTRRQFTQYDTARPFRDNRLIFMLFWILVFWAGFVVHTESIIRFNQPPQTNTSPTWQFGQILPLFLTLLPFINMVNTFYEFGLRPIKQVYQQAKVSVIYDRDFEDMRAAAL
ncbi:hypothetical protein C8R46DRAFT_1088514 [Mycena filopes]|nr:hypothetical protein C8R46DRAFT_1088514 [Mycena filopes]